MEYTTRFSIVAMTVMLLVQYTGYCRCGNGSSGLFNHLHDYAQ